MNEKLNINLSQICPNYPIGSSDKTDLKTWREQAPFWYKGDTHQSEFKWPVGNPDEYSFKTLPQPMPDKSLLEAMEIERPERYLPGEIYRNESPKKPVEDLSKTANCSKIWAPKDPNFFCEFQPTQNMLNPPLLLDGILERKAKSKHLNKPSEAKDVENYRQCCEGVEDLQTKAKPRHDYLESLKYVDTRPANFTCAPDTKVKLQNSCKISEPNH